MAGVLSSPALRVLELNLYSLQNTNLKGFVRLFEAQRLSLQANCRLLGFAAFTMASAVIFSVCNTLPDDSAPGKKRLHRCMLVARNTSEMAKSTESFNAMLN